MKAGQGTERMVRAVLAFARDLRDQLHNGAPILPHWLTILGSSGNGKTHSALRVWRWWQRNNWKISHREARLYADGTFVKFGDFLSECRRGDWSREEQLRNYDLVILDEIGAAHDPSGLGKDLLFRVLDARLGKWTILTGNLTMEQIAEHDVRIASRLIRNNNKVVVNDDTDHALNSTPIPNEDPQTIQPD